MRPNTRHKVLTVQDCLVIGGHFYSPVCYDRTLTGIVYEHFFGSLITNQTHATSGLVLFKLLAKYHRYMSALLAGEGISHVLS